MEERVSPFVSVIIPVLNEERVIRECLNSLVELDYPPERREILVVDNGSTDRTAEIIKTFPVRYLWEERRGASAARNKGIEASKGEILTFTDADCVVTTGWLREVVKAIDEEGVGGVAGEVVAYPPKTPAEWYAAKVRHLSPRKYLFRPIMPFAVFANLAFRRGVFEKIGLLDEGFLRGESTDFVPVSSGKRIWNSSLCRRLWCSTAIERPRGNSLNSNGATGWVTHSSTSSIERRFLGTGERAFSLIVS